MNACQKGKRGELELAHFLTDRGFIARRGQQFSGGTDSPDVVCGALAGLHIECKRTEAGNPYVWLKQAMRDAGPNKIPVVFHRRNDEEWVVVVKASDFLKFMGPGTQPALNDHGQPYLARDTNLPMAIPPSPNKPVWVGSAEQDTTHYPKHD